MLPLDYAYRPGQEEDGVTIRVSVREAEALTAAALDWAVPGHLKAKVLHLLKALPINQRRTLIPLAETARASTRAVARRPPARPAGFSRRDARRAPARRASLGG